MGNGDDDRGSLVEAVRQIPLFGGLGRAALRAVVRHVDVVDLPGDAVVVEKGRPVRWVAASLGAALRAQASHDRWPPGEVVALREALTHGLAGETVVTTAPGRVLFVDIRAVTAAISVEPAFGLAVARAVAAVPAARVRRERGFARRVVAGVPGAVA